MLITYRVEVSFPFMPKEWTAWVNTGVLLAMAIAHELRSIRKRGIFSVKQFEKLGFTVDHVGHLAGYATGITAAMLVRQHDPHWRDIERTSFWYLSRNEKSPTVSNHRNNSQRSDSPKVEKPITIGAQ